MWQYISHAFPQHVDLFFKQIKHESHESLEIPLYPTTTILHNVKQGLHIIAVKCTVGTNWSLFYSALHPLYMNTPEKFIGFCMDSLKLLVAFRD